MNARASMQITEPTSFEGQIESFKQDAQGKYDTAIQNIRMGVLSDRFNRLLERKIIPALGRIGFEEQLCRSLFEMTSPTWELIGSVGEDVELMYPVFMRDIREIREGVLSNSSKESRARSVLDEMDPQATHALMKKTMHPENLLEDFQDISLSWVILPRAYDLLEKDHSRYMLIYLKSLDKETELEFSKILARVIVEFIGNYSLKYMEDVQLRDRALNIFFYGYATMFWKNLMNPPGGLEDGLLFDSFYRWAKMIHFRFASSNEHMAKTTERMEKEKEKIFPDCNIFDLAHHHSDVERLFVALRHGVPGVESVIRYFGIGGTFLKDKTDGKLPYVAVPKTLNALFSQIKKRYCFETPRTRKSIREFLYRLGSNYNLKRIKALFCGNEPPETLRFVGPRVCRMTQDLTKSLQLAG